MNFDFQKCQLPIPDMVTLQTLEVKMLLEIKNAFYGTVHRG